jgi:hypothetical protein
VETQKLSSSGSWRSSLCIRRRVRRGPLLWRTTDTSSKRESLPFKIIVCFTVLNFIGGAFVKLGRLPVELDYFRDAQLPPWMMPFIGIAETAITLLLIPKVTSTLGAIAGSSLMIGALASVIASQWWILLPVPVVTFVSLVYIGWLRRAHLFAWLSPRGV